MAPLIHIVIPSYEIMATIGAIVSLVFLYFRMDKYGITFKNYLLFIIVGAPALFVGSRLLFVVSFVPEMVSDCSFDQLIHYTINGGIVFYGGMLGLVFAIWLSAKIQGVDTRNALSFFAPVIPLFHIFGRIGCFFAGCCYGIPIYGGIPMAFDPTVGRLPVQLIESACNIIIFILMLKIEEKSNHLLSIYFLLYGIVRFTDEFFRGDSVRGLWGMLSTSQIVSLILLIFAVIILMRDKKNNDNPEII